MLNVVIVDDEPLVRITLKSIIPWEKYGLFVYGEAENGKQCLTLLEDKKIDIIITDIKMPVIDGIELIKIVKEKYQHISVIVLSAYEEFGLVKKALMNGAEDYILKSEFNESSLENTLLTVKKKIESNNKKIQYEMDLKKDITENIDVLRINFFKELLFSNTLSDEQIERKTKQYNITLNNNQLILIVLAISELKPNEKILENVIKNFIDELFKKEKDYFCLVSNKLEVTILRSYYEVKSESKIYQMIDEDINTIHGSIKKFLNIDVTTGVSKIFNSFGKLSEKYEKTKELLNYRFHLGKENIFYEKDFENKIIPINLDYINTLYANFRSSVEKLDINNAKILLGNITVEFNEHYSNQNYRTLEFYCKLLTSIVDKSIELSLYNFIFKDDINPYEHVLHSKTIYNVENYLSSLLDDLEKGTGIELKTQYGDTIGKVMNYVLINYDKDINLNKVSEELKFNPSYLSTKFKEITQYSFNEYLNTVRINNAKKLMADRKYRFNQIASMVGYNDQRYFCKIFKKIVGITPREYINALSYS
jgi:two-component system response regulator YesN